MTNESGLDGAAALSPERPDAGEVILEAAGVQKSFFGNPALRDGSIEVRSGEIHALLGENGAGKSTLIKIIAGVYQRDAGSVTIAGEEMGDRIAPARVRDLGVAFIHQDLALVQDSSVAENIAMVDGYPKRRGLVSLQAMREQASERLAAIDSDIDPRAMIMDLSSADQALVAIARALISGARLVVLDEPTARLRRPEVEHLFERLRRLQARGAGFIYITHRLGEVFQLADRVTVIRDGKTVAVRAIADVDEDRIISDIVGRDLGEVFPEPKRRPREGEPILRMKGLTTPHVSDVDLEVFPREIVGLAGLVSRAPSSLAKAAFGVEEVLSGEVTLNGKKVRQGSYPSRIGEVAYVPGDRHSEGLAVDMTIRENLLLGDLVLATKGSGGVGWVPTDETRRARVAIKNFQISPAEPEALVATLSGGNQQKVLISKWISTDPKLLILEEPTAGVDIGTKAEIYRMIAELADQGAAILLVSSDLEEVSSLSHRVLVIRQGHIAVELDHDSVTHERVAAESYRVA